MLREWQRELPHARGSQWDTEKDLASGYVSIAMDNGRVLQSH